MPYSDSGYGRSLADLMRQRGDREAEMYLRQGDASAQMWGQAGQSITNAIGGWQRNVQENRQREIEAARESRRAEDEGIQIERAKMGLAREQRKEKGESLTRSLLPLARREDGLATYDRNLISREFEAAGMADQLPDVLSKLDEQDASHMKVLQARRDAVGMDAFRVLQSGGDENTYAGLLQYWEENDALPPRELKAMKELGKDPAKRQQALMAAVQSSPTALKQLQAMQTMNAPKLHNVPEGSTVIDERTGKVIMQGQPKAPANIEDAILNATDPAERQRLIDLKKELTAAGRAPAQPVQPPPVQSKSLINDKGELVEGYFDPRARKYFDAQGNVIANPRPASTREQGRQVTSGDAGRIAEFDTSLDDVKVLRGTVAPRDKQTGELIEPGATGTSAKIGAGVWNWVTEWTGIGATAKSKQAVIDRVKQVIGKALEGGVLRKEDEAKYEKILPTIGDPVEVVETKLDGLEKALKLRRERTIESLTDAGYDTSKFRQRDTSANGGGPAVGERRTVQGQLAEWDGKGWKAVP